MRRGWKTQRKGMIRLGPAQLALLQALAKERGGKVPSVSYWISVARLPGGRTSAYSSVHGLDNRGWITMEVVGSGYECQITQSGRDIVTARVDFCVKGDRGLLERHGLVPPEGVLYC